MEDVRMEYTVRVVRRKDTLKIGYLLNVYVTSLCVVRSLNLKSTRNTIMLLQHTLWRDLNLNNVHRMVVSLVGASWSMQPRFLHFVSQTEDIACVRLLTKSWLLSDEPFINLHCYRGMQSRRLTITIISIIKASRLSWVVVKLTSYIWLEFIRIVYLIYIN